MASKQRPIVRLIRSSAARKFFVWALPIATRFIVKRFTSNKNSGQPRKYVKNKAK